MKMRWIISAVVLLAITVLMGSCDPAVTVPITPIAFDMDFNPVAVDARDGRQLGGLERLAIEIPAMPQLRGFSVQDISPDLTTVLEDLIGAFDFEIFFSRGDYSTAVNSLFAQGTVQRGSNQFTADRNAPGLQSLLETLNPDQAETLFVSVRHNYQGDAPVRGQMEVSGDARVGLDLFR